MSTQMTITEALAEIKTIGKRIQKKQEFVLEHLARQERFKDPLASSGGSQMTLQVERQAIHDLETRIKAIRLAIQRANLDTTLTVSSCNGFTFVFSIAEWLIWRREISGGQSRFLTNIAGALSRVRQEAQQKGLQVVGNVSAVATAGEQKDSDVIINVDEKEIAQDRENLEDILGKLDGQLSLLNATTVIEIAD